MNTPTQGQMLASLVAVLDAAELGASLVAQKDRRSYAERRKVTRAGGRRGVDRVSSARELNTFGAQGAFNSLRDAS